MTTTVKVLSSNKELASYKVSKEQALVLKAQEHVNYQLIDDQTGLGPQNIVTKRENNDLKIFLNDGDPEADIIIEDYYDDDMTDMIIGQHENGNLYAYAPESGLKSDAINLLAEQAAAPQALGGSELSSAFWAFNPWWLLAIPVVGGIIAAAASGGGGGNGGNNTPAPEPQDVIADKPVLVAQNDGSVTVTPGADNTMVEVSFIDENGNNQSVTVIKGDDGKWVIDEKDPNTDVTVDPDTGVITIPPDSVKDGSDVNATGTDNNNNKGEGNTVTAGDHHIPGDSDGDGTADDNSTNNVTLPNGQEVPRNTDGAPNIIFGEDSNNDGQLNGTEVVAKDPKDTTPVYITIPDNTEAGDSLIVTVNGQEQTIPVTEEMINNGYTTIDVPVTKDGDITVTAKVTDPAGNSSNQGENKVTVDTTPPATPDIEPKTDGSVDVKLPEDATQVVVKVPQENGPDKEVTLTKDPEGNWTSDDTDTIPNPEAGNNTATIPPDNIKPGSEITAEAKDTAGNTSQDSEDLADKPTITSPDNDGKVTVTPGEDNTKVEVKFPNEEGSEKNVTATKGDDGKWTIVDDGTGATVDPDSGVITIPADQVKDGEPVNATGTNGAGNSADANTVNAGNDPTVPDTSADAPTVTPGDNGNLTVTPGADNTKVEVPFEDEAGQNQKITITKNPENGKWSVSGTAPTGVTVDETTGTITIDPEAIADNQDVTATGTDANSNTGTHTGTTKPDTAAPAVDNSNNDGVVSAPATVNEGGSVVTTVKLTNNNGGTLPLVIGSTGEGKFGSDDFETPEFSNGVSYDAETGTLTIPKGVKEFTITTKAKEDASTEGTETGKFTVGGVEGNVVTVNDTSNDPTVPDTSADAPTVTPGDNGNLTVTPGADNTKVEVPFEDEAGQNQKITITKNPENGKWSVSGTAPTGVTVDETTGTITIDPEAIADNQDVTATGTDANSNTGTHTGTTKPDTAAPAVDNSNNDGVVSAPDTVNEGGSVVTTVKLTNNNGGTLPLVIGSTGEGKFGSDDFETPEFSDGVTYDAETGTLTIPKGVKEFTITTKAKEDASTEGTETGKFTVGGVEGNVVTVNDTSNDPTVPDTSADAPTVTPGDNGNLTVTPGADNTKVEVPFEDQAGQNQKITITKNPENGKWSVSGTAPTGVTVDETTGTITIDPEAIADNQDVTATGTDANSNTGTHTGTTKPDTAAPAVDNSNNDGVVSAPDTVNEGGSVVTTVKLTNNNGGTLPLVIGSTGEGKFGSDDFETPEFSDGVTYDAETGTLTIPKGVKEFTITTKAKEDASTEGTETGKFTVGGVEGNEVTVNDTSFKPELPIDITSIAGTEQPAGAEEANTPYAAISLQDISAGFTVSGTSQLEAGTVITVTINNPETIYRYSTSSRGWFMDT